MSGEKRKDMMMDRNELRAIVLAEGTDPVVFLDEEGDRENAVALKPEPDGWSVHITSERAGPIPSTVKSFATEAEALDYMLAKSRRLTRNRRLAAEHRAQRRAAQEN